MKLIYFAPSGEEDRDFAVADLAPMLRKGGTSYWNVGSGGALLSYGPVERGRTMQIYFVARQGFHLIFNDGRNSPLAGERKGANPKPKWVEIHVGGEPTRISTRQVVSRGDAEAAINHFASEGEAWPGIAWASAR
jgi:hypothetical protein